MAEVRIKRVYEPAESGDGFRILVDRLWPRGVSKERASIDLWLKDIAPSPALRTWFAHEPERFPEFRTRYLAELQDEPGRTALEKLRAMAEQQVVTLVYAARDGDHCNARVLRDVLAKS